MAPLQGIQGSGSDGVFGKSRCQAMMDRFLVSLAVSVMLLAGHAYAQDDEESASAIEAEERTCIPADEVEQSSGAESGLSQEGEDSTELPLCEEPEAEEVAPETEPQAAGSEEELQMGDDIDPSQEFEVDPEDEISEDYPVPLPSDI